MLVLAMPTANGSLHLGHIGGPYLKMDVLKRHFQQKCYDVCLVGGIDAHDSYIKLQAVKENSSTAAIASKYYTLIKHDLLKMNIEFDSFINTIAL